MNRLFYGDNLAVLRESIADELVDLIYLDPPSNFSASYNVLFKAPSGDQSQARIEAFEDTWHWTTEGGRARNFSYAQRPDSRDGAGSRAAGFYETGGMKVPRLQILTAAQILDNRRPQVPFRFTKEFRKAEREEEKTRRFALAGPIGR
jgi:hypothetical protein